MIVGMIFVNVDISLFIEFLRVVFNKVFMYLDRIDY